MIASDRGVHLSKMSGKLDGLRAINTNTVTNPFCIKMKESDTICGHCYSHRMLDTYRKSCQPAFQHNSELLSSAPLNVIPRFNDLYVRFHGHGELINGTHFRNLCAIAAGNPDTTFSLWTKQRKLVLHNLHYKPANLILIYSNPVLDNIIDVPVGFDKVFNNITDPKGEANCTGQKCMDCLVCYKHNTETVIVEHVK